MLESPAKRDALSLREIARRGLAYGQSDRGFLTLVIAGTIARLLLTLLTSNSYDLWFFGSVAVAAKAHRPLYADTTFSYPPLWGYAFEDAGKLLGLFHVPVLVHVAELAPFALPGLTKLELTTPAASLLLKLPALLVDAALAVTLYRAALRLGASLAVARTVALGVWLNPLALITAPIQANWDAIVPLTMLVAIACALDERWFLAGAVAAIGVWAKLSPLFLAFFVPALVYAPSMRELPLLARRVGGIALGAGIASVVILMPVIVHGELGPMLASVFARTGTFTIGGTNVIAFAQLKEAALVHDAIAAHRVVYGRLSLLLMACGCVLPAALLLRRTARDFIDYCLGVTAILCAICIASPFVQPTYIIWIVPTTTFLAATTDRRWWWPTAILTVSGVVFFAAVRAPQALLEPACVFFHLCDPVAFAAQAASYNAAPGFGVNTLQVTINVVAGEIAGIAIVATYVFALRALTRPLTSRSQAQSPSNTTRVTRRSRFPFVLACGLVALCAGTLSPLPVAPRLDITGDTGRAIISAHGFSGEAYACALPRSTPHVTQIDAYFDPRYPNLRGVSATFEAGFGAHFIDALQRKKIDASFAIVDAERLPSFLKQPPNGRALLVLGGVLPATVRAQGYDLLKPWVLAGGTIFWAGGPFDLIWSRKHPASETVAYGGPDPQMWPTLYSTHGDTIFARAQNIFAPPVTFGTRTDPRWHLPAIEFVRTTLPLNSGPLLHGGGRILGSIDAHLNSSISSLPVGNGTLVFFADAFDDEISASDVLSQLLLCSTWSPRAHAVRYDGYLPDGGPPMTIVLPHDTAKLDIFGDVDGLGPYATYRP
jgi:hypothetical protein